jgi:hypothetical protein
VNFARKLWQRSKDLLPISGFYFDRPIVLLQSDDWGRVGLRDREGLEELRSAGLTIGERPYDFYTLETAEDLWQLKELLMRHRDASGRHPLLEMNFILANPDFARMREGGFRQVHLLPLSEGLPGGWSRPGLLQAYREGIADLVFQPALHGNTHFCHSAVQRQASADTERGDLLRKFWAAGTPYIHWRMPWIGYEYWNPEMAEDERFLSAEAQREEIGRAVGYFAKMFSSLPRSACAPGYRANDDTQKAWAQHGVRVAQNGPHTPLPPYFDEHGVLQLSRTIEFEPATDSGFSVELCLQQAANCFRRGIPAIVSLHSINFHSSVQGFCSRTLECLEEFLSALESNYADLLYLRDEDIYEVVQSGSLKTEQGSTQVNVVNRKFAKASAQRAV